MCRCLVDVCPVEELETHKTEITEKIPQKEDSPEPLPPKKSTPASQPELGYTPSLESAVQPEPNGEDHARAKSPSPIVSPGATIRPEIAASGSSPPAIIQVKGQIRAVMRDCYSDTAIKDSYFQDYYSAKSTRD